MNNTRPLIYVVDDDVSVRKGLDNLLRSAGFAVQTFSSAREFLAECAGGCAELFAVGCAASRVERIRSDKSWRRPVCRSLLSLSPVMGTFRVGAGMKAGALQFLTKPVNDEDLLDAIQQAIGRDHRARQRRNIGQLHFEEIIGTSPALARCCSRWRLWRRRNRRC